MPRELLEALCHASAELQRLHKQAVDANRNDIARIVRDAGRHVADAIVQCVPSKEAS